MDTYQFCSSLVTQHARAGAAVLDYGCGAGQIVAQLRTAGYDARGCDVFYEGGDYSPSIPREMQPFILRMDGDRIPFRDGEFDVVISNQVMEHVPDLDVVVREIARVLKPGGTALNVFPDRGVWREGHCGVPLLHWFPKRSGPRVYYAALMRSLGFGAHKQDKTVMQWSRDFCAWLDMWTYYRSSREVHATFARYFAATEHGEQLWFEARFADRARGVPPTLQRFIVRKLAGMVLMSTQPRREPAPLASST